jgi:hypothetical protein
MPMFWTTLASTLLLGSGAAADSGALACKTMMTDHLPLNTRQSPLDSLQFTVGTTHVKLCYGRPSTRGRVMLGGNSVPYGKLWRTGANEPTMIHTDGPLVLASLPLPPGSYSIYSVPDTKTWQVIVNRSITQWGHEASYTEAVKAQELGRVLVESAPLDPPLETLTFVTEPGSTGNTVNLVLEWESTRVPIPIQPGS